MSHQHNQDRSFRQEEFKRGSNINRMVSRCKGRTIVGGPPSMLVSNYEIMVQLYRMRDTLKKFGTRLDSIESRHRERSTQLS